MAITIPEVAPAEARDDAGWFANNPARNFRARAGQDGIWLIRRLAQGADPAVYSRAFTSSITVSSNAEDRGIALHWFQAAYPHWSPETCRKRAKKALGKGTQ